MLYLILILAVWRLYKRIKRHCKRYPYSIADYQQHEKPIETENYSIADYLPQTIPKAEEQTQVDDPALDFAKMEVERLQALKQEYMQVLDNIEQEQADLQAEYKQASIKRKSAISAKLTSLARQHASTTKTLQGIDAKIEKQYYKINVGG